MAEKYITEEQRAKCRKVADAFAELYELADVMLPHILQCQTKGTGTARHAHPQG